MSDDDFEQSKDSDSDFEGGDDSSDDEPLGSKKKSSKTKAKSSPKKSKKADDGKEAKANNKRKKTTESKEPSKAVKTTKNASASSAKAAAPAEGGSAPVIRGGDAASVVLNYLTDQNRPYSQNQIFDNLHGAVRKADVPRVADKLVEQGKLVAFTFGKTKLYMADQSAVVQLDNAALDKLDSEISERTDQVKARRQELHALEAEVTALENQPTNAEADAKIAELEAQVAAKRAKLETLQAQTNLVSTEDLNKRRERLKMAWKEWKTRKRACLDMVDCCLGESSTKPREFLEERGCEVDEDVGVSDKNFTQLLSIK